MYPDPGMRITVAKSLKRGSFAAVTCTSRGDFYWGGPQKNMSKRSAPAATASE